MSGVFERMSAIWNIHLVKSIESCGPPARRTISTPTISNQYFPASMPIMEDFIEWILKEDDANKQKKN